LPRTKSTSPPTIKPRRVRASIPKADRRVEHRTFGVGIARFRQQLDDSSYAADVKFGDGVIRTIRLDQVYWVTSVGEIMLLAAHLPPHPKPVAKALKARTVEREPEVDGEVAQDELIYEDVRDMQEAA
jgi:hypothetical protein